MTIMDTSHPFYRPLWVRLIITGFCALWSGVEFFHAQPFWGTIVGGVALWSAYALLLTYKPAPAEAKPAPEEPQGGA